MTKTLLALSSVALAATLVGCGGSGSGGSPSASPTVNALDLGVKYAQCMRQHGIKMEDPKPGGGISLGIRKGEEAKAKAAQAACKAYSPEQVSPHTMTAAELDRQTKMAQCMRRHGIDMPDPKPGQPSRIRVRSGGKAKLDEASKACDAEVGVPSPDAGGSLSKQNG